MDRATGNAEISADHLARLLEQTPAGVAIVDVRAATEVARWRIEGPVDVPRVERAYWDVLGSPELIAGDLPEDATAVVVCAYGNTSALVAEELRGVGVDARTLAGGMVAWSRLHVEREVGGLPAGAYVTQLERPAKGCLSYVVGVEGGPALVVDPDRFFDDHLAVVARHGSRIVGVVDTHLHADHVSGGPALARARGVPYLLADDHGATVDHDRVADGQVLLDDDAVVARAVALHAPGHTPGSTGIRVGERLLLSGDTLFVRGIGRPDLGGRADEWGRELHSTLTRRLAPLGDDVVVLPAHYQHPRERAGRDFYGAALGELRRQPEFSLDLDRFLAEVTSSAGTAPSEYGDIRRVNLGVDERPAEDLDELEVGRNQCAASTTS